MITRRQFVKTAIVGGGALFLPKVGILRPTPAQAAIALDQTRSITVDAFNTSTALSFISAPAAGSSVFAIGWGWQNPGFDVTLVEDNNGNPYSVIKTSTTAGRMRSFVAHAHNVNASTTPFAVTLTTGLSTCYMG